MFRSDTAVFTPRELRVRELLQHRRWRQDNKDWFYPKRNAARREKRLRDNGGRQLKSGAQKIFSPGEIKIRRRVRDAIYRKNKHEARIQVGAGSGGVD